MPESAPDQLVERMVEPVLAELGFSLLQVSWNPGRRGSVLRLTVDRPGGVTIDDCGTASEAVSAVLDRHEELLPGTYSLEVSSPGAERELLSEADYLAALGRRVRLTLEQGDTHTVLEGRLTAVGGEDLEMEVRRHRGGRLVQARVLRQDVVAAQVVVDL
ncbi:MAG TPA: ribosome maturation factor RimP [Candidatus Nanopelagicaceae bacterium]|nr:ribosome maturation factor RimP [Candidatus Nanopelagicaceae bacterium]